MQTDYDVIIVGGGAAGLAAAVYTTRSMLKTAIVERIGMGGQILVTGDIDNYPGFPNGIQGPELARMFEEQAQRFGANFLFELVVRIQDEGEVKRVITDQGEHTARALIVATGGSHRKLGVPGEEQLAGRGVSYCAVCDGNFFRGKDVVVVGGGDAALDEGLYLTGIVNSVTVVHRRDQLRAQPILRERAFKTSNMKFLWNHVCREIRGNGVVDRVLLEDLKTGRQYDYPACAVFIYIGFVVNSQYLHDIVEMDDMGHIACDIRMKTSAPGIFAAGDIRQHSNRQLGTAVGDGITAALNAYAYLTEAAPHSRPVTPGAH